VFRCPFYCRYVLYKSNAPEIFSVWSETNRIHYNPMKMTCEPVPVAALSEA
jgi:hypothetical protein